MITWMQKHKSWLVITIWISTIAFVGAGFVGWGSYDISKSAGSVATVGSKKIEMKDLQSEYSNLYSQYEQMFGQTFNKELADKLKLEETAYNNLVQKYLLLNLAEEFGLMATDKQVAQELVKISSFIIEGKFDKATYVKVLKQNRTNPTDFEAQIKKDLTIQKLTKIYASTINQESIKNINKLFFASDKISINIIDNSKTIVKVNDTDMKKYWEANKDKYKSVKQYKINIEKIAINGDAKKSKKTALKKYLSLKKANSKFTTTEFINDSTTYLQKEDLDKIITSKIGTILKPIKIKDNYIVVQLIQIIKPQTLAFADVKSEVEIDYVNKAKQDKLQEKVNALIKNFKGKDIGYITKEANTMIAGLSPKEVTDLVSSVFASKVLINSINLGSKTVVYKILDTKLATYDAKKDTYLEETILKIKDQETISKLIDKLRLKYTVTSNMQVNN